jgi:penicillin-binding protein 2
VNVYKAISLSCDTFFYAVGGGWDKISGLGIRKMDNYFTKFGLGTKTGIDLTGEVTGLVPTPDWKQEVKKEAWYQGDTYHAAIGQGDLLVTPLQLANTVATIANGGRLIKPHFVNKITDAEGQLVEEVNPEVIDSNFINPEYINVDRAGMRQVVTSGTGRALANLPVAAAGKTGTAQFDNNQQTHAWFTAFAPYDDPQIALVVLVEGGGEGNETAVPVAHDILNYYFTRK